MGWTQTMTGDNANFRSLDKAVVLRRHYSVGDEEIAKKRKPSTFPSSRRQAVVARFRLVFEAQTSPVVRDLFARFKSLFSIRSLHRSSFVNPFQSFAHCPTILPNSHFSC